MGLLTLWQAIMSTTNSTFSTFEIDNKPIPNILTSGFDIQEHINGDKMFEGIGIAKAYTFEVDAPCTVYIEDFGNNVWHTLATITAPDNITSFTRYKGIVIPTSGATKSRIRLSGQNYYKATSMALYSYPLLIDRIPDYKPWVKHTMPDDFKSLDQIVKESPERDYTRDSTFKWEGKGDLYVAYDYVGKIRVIYRPVPSPITALTQVLEVDSVSAVSGSYFLASHLILIEDPASSSFFQQVYEELKRDNNIKLPASESPIMNVYGSNMGV